MKLISPVISASHPNAPAYFAAVANAVNAPTIAMQNEAVGQANLLGTNLNFLP